MFRPAPKSTPKVKDPYPGIKRTPLKKPTKPIKQVSGSDIRKHLDKLWKLFSYFTKLHASLDGIHCRCFTCNKLLKIGSEDCQGGHWLNKKNYSYHYFTEDNVRPQCNDCNCVRDGNEDVFEQRLIEQIGIHAVAYLDQTKHISEKRDLFWYKEMIVVYTGKIAEELKRFK